MSKINWLRALNGAALWLAGTSIAVAAGDGGAGGDTDRFIIMGIVAALAIYAFTRKPETGSPGAAGGCCGGAASACFGGEATECVETCNDAAAESAEPVAEAVDAEASEPAASAES